MQDPQAKGPTPELDPIEAFLRSGAARGLSVNTRRWYRYTLAPLLQQGLPGLPRAPERLETLLADLHISPATRHGFWRAWRAFYRWAARRQLLPDAAASLQPPILRPQLPRSLNIDQVKLILRRAPTRRDRALLYLLLDTGLRIGEAASLRWKDVGTATCTVNGKTGQREVPLSNISRRLLIGLGNAHHLWLGPRGPLTTSGLAQAVRRSLRRAGIPAGPHVLRHTFARLYITAGGDVFSLQRILGHHQISTTRRYVELDMRDVVAQHARFSPIARLK